MMLASARSVSRALPRRQFCTASTIAAPSEASETPVDTPPAASTGEDSTTVATDQAAVHDIKDPNPNPHHHKRRFVSFKRFSNFAIEADVSEYLAAGGLEAEVIRPGYKSVGQRLTYDAKLTYSGEWYAKFADAAAANSALKLHSKSGLLKIASQFVSCY
jgi:hypothetical protein